MAIQRIETSVVTVEVKGRYHKKALTAADIIAFAQDLQDAIDYAGLPKSTEVRATVEVGMAATLECTHRMQSSRDGVDKPAEIEEPEDEDDRPARRVTVSPIRGRKASDAAALVKP